MEFCCEAECWLFQILKQEFFKLWVCSVILFATATFKNRILPFETAALTE